MDKNGDEQRSGDGRIEENEENEMGKTPKKRLRLSRKGCRSTLLVQLFGGGKLLRWRITSDKKP
jgi:hypothetical protein